MLYYSASMVNGDKYLLQNCHIFSWHKSVFAVFYMIRQPNCLGANSNYA